LPRCAPILEREPVPDKTGRNVLHDVAPDGRVLLATVNTRVGIRCLPPGASEERDLVWLDVSNVQELSNDGKDMLFSELSYGEGRNSAIYLRPTDGRPAVMRVATWNVVAAWNSTRGAPVGKSSRSR